MRVLPPGVDAASVRLGLSPAPRWIATAGRQAERGCSRYIDDGPSAATASASAASAGASAAAAAPAAARDTDEDPSWAWPTGTAVGAGFDEQRNKGLAFFGKSGDAVLAAADGRVVYAGSGLRGYGNLVIIKHNATYLTA